MDFKTFINACAQGDSDTVQRGLGEISLTQADILGRTPLMWAVISGRFRLLPSLIPGSDLQQGDAHGLTALMWAACNPNLDIVRALIANSDLNHVDNNGWTALMHAAGQGRGNVIQALIPHSNLRQAAHDGTTAMMLASENGELAGVQVLLVGSDLDQRDKTNNSALMLAVAKKNWDVVDLLADHHPFRERLEWPEAATREMLPRWHARTVDLEQKTLQAVIQHHELETPVGPLRSRL